MRHQLVSDAVIGQIKAALPELEALAKEAADTSRRGSSAYSLEMIRLTQRLVTDLIVHNAELAFWKKSVKQIKQVLDFLDAGSGTAAAVVFDNASYRLAKLMQPILASISNDDLPLFDGKLLGMIANRMAGKDKARFIAQVKNSLDGHVALYDLCVRSELAMDEYMAFSSAYNKVYAQLIEMASVLTPASSAAERAAFDATYREFVGLVVQMGKQLPYLVIASSHEYINLPKPQRMLEIRSQGMAAGCTFMQKMIGPMGIEHRLNKILAARGCAPVSTGYQCFAGRLAGGEHAVTASAAFDGLVARTMRAIDQYLNGRDWRQLASTRKIKGKPNSTKQRMLGELATTLRQLCSDRADALATADAKRAMGIATHLSADVVSVRAFTAYAKIMATIQAHEDYCGKKWMVSLGEGNNLLHQYALEICRFCLSLDERHDADFARTHLSHAGAAVAAVDAAFSEELDKRLADNAALPRETVNTALVEQMAALQARLQPQVERAQSIKAAAITKLQAAGRGMLTRSRLAQQRQQQAQTAAASRIQGLWRHHRAAADTTATAYATAEASARASAV